MNASNYDVAADDVVLHVVAPDAAAKPLEAMSDADIATLYDDEARAARRVLTAGRAAGVKRFVFVLPSIVEMGAPDYSATCAAAEAVRVLALGAARQWRDDGVTVNCITARWPYAASMRDDVAPLVSFLASDAGADVSGVTIPVGGPDPGL